jgi:type IV secretory pathway VirB4 component
LTPFRPWKEMVDASGSIDMEAVQDIVTFLELCVREEGQRGFDKLTVQLVSQAVRLAYESEFRARPDERPLMRHFRAAIGLVGTKATHADDKRIAEDLHRRLSLFVGDSLYGAFLDRPSELRFDARLITFDMAAVSKSPITRSIAMATVMTTITTRAASRMRRTLVEVDEGHAYLGQDETAERFLERCYRVMRKYDVAMWMISQQFADFAKAKSGDAILGNSPIKIFLRHRSGHDVVSDYFRFSPRARAAFSSLDMLPGQYSDLMLLYGERMATVRLALHPLAYWILTTDADDKKLIARAAEKNPGLPPLELLKQLAQHYPHGAPKGHQRAA